MRLGRRRVAAVAAVLFVSLLAPRAGASAERRDGYVLDWDSGTGKSYVIPAAEIVGFIFALNAFNRVTLDSDDYDTDGHSIWRNLRLGSFSDNCAWVSAAAFSVIRTSAPASARMRSGKVSVLMSSSASIPPTGFRRAHRPMRERTPMRRA